MNSFTITSIYTMGSLFIGAFMLWYAVWLHSYLYAYVHARWGSEASHRFLHFEETATTFLLGTSSSLVMLKILRG